jgi:hypothetical protein
MTKEQIKKDSPEPPIERSPSFGKVSKEKSSSDNPKRIGANVSFGLDINPPSSNLSEISEKQDDRVFSGNNETEFEEKSWLREFVKERLDIDPPASDPSKVNKNSPNVPVSPDPNSNDSIKVSDSALPGNLAPFDKSASNLNNPTNIETEKRNPDENRNYTEIQALKIDTIRIDDEQTEPPGYKLKENRGNNTDKQESSSRENGKDQILSLSPAVRRNGDSEVNSPNHIRTPNVNDDNKIAKNSPLHEVGDNGRDEIAPTELISGLESSSNLSTDKEDSSATPEVKPKRKASWVFTSIPLMMVITVGAWALRDFTFGQYSIDEPEESYSQSNLTSISEMIYDTDFSSAEINPTPEPPIYDHSVLTQIQKDRLYKASLTYLADDEEEAVYIARKLNYVQNEGHPATLCGPLAISILRDAMLIDRYVDLEDFWLLNPRDDYTVRAILEKYFPREHYQWYQTSTPINYYDFKNHPLYSGDFLYLFAGRGGTFEHMIVVSRVDDAGRAYSVSAQQDSNGYSINEVMLYDPNNPGEGYFYEITDSANAEFGVTGLGGFWMWRRLSTFPEVNLDDVAFSDQLDSVLNESGGEWYGYIKEIDGRVVFSREAQDLGDSILSSIGLPGRERPNYVFI